MNNDPRVYTKFVGFRLSDDLDARLQKFSAMLGRKKSDVIRYLLTRCITSYATDRAAIAKIRQELY